SRGAFSGDASPAALPQALENLEMHNQKRRAALLSLAAAAAAPVVIHAGAAWAQTAPAESTGDQSEYVMQTLMVGTLSLQMSEVAMEKANEPLVQEFAQL